MWAVTQPLHLRPPRRAGAGGCPWLSAAEQEGLTCPSREEAPPPPWLRTELCFRTWLHASPCKQQPSLCLSFLTKIGLLGQVHELTSVKPMAWHLAPELQQDLGNEGQGVQGPTSWPTLPPRPCGSSLPLSPLQPHQTPRFLKYQARAPQGLHPSFAFTWSARSQPQASHVHLLCVFAQIPPSQGHLP